MRIELVYAPGCADAETARARLRGVLQQLGITDRLLRERVDPDRPSPSVLVNGIDVMASMHGVSQ